MALVAQLDTTTTNRWHLERKVGSLEMGQTSRQVVGREVRNRRKEKRRRETEKKEKLRQKTINWLKDDIFWGETPHLFILFIYTQISYFFVS